jgi:DNA invertase Pin-like site-specific DNA recombinase
MTQLVGYGRVSTSSGEQLSALETQLSWLKQQGCARILHDVESGLNVSRTCYTQLVELIESGSVSHLTATRADRLGRDGPEMVRLIQICDRMNVIVTTRDDGTLSARTAEELLMLFVRAALAQGESMKIRQRVLAARAVGKRLGKPMRQPCWGYVLAPDRMSLLPDPVTFPRARRFVDLLLSSNWRLMPSLESFTEPIPLRSIRAVRAWLLNPTIRGAIAYGQLPNHLFEEILWDRHPAILTHDEFASFQRAAARNRRHWGSNARRQVRAITGLCICEECGLRMKYVAGRTIPSVRCNGDLCSQKYRCTHEATIIRFATAELQQQAAEQLASSVSQGDSPEAIELRRQIAAVEALRDPDMEPIIRQKRQRLEAILVAPQADTELLEQITDPRFWDVATYAEVTEILQATVAEIHVARQAPTAIRLKL